jgi:uncharacterized membrane protein HdeD (DUF308 family)
MLDLFARNWWLIAIRGIAALAFGILAIVWPGPTLVVLVALFGAYALVDGLSLLWSLLRGEPDARRNAWAVAIMGVLGVVAAIVTFFLPGLTAITLVYVIGFWAILMGIFEIAAAIRLRREISGELWMAIGGVLAILFGLYLVVFPGSGIISLVFVVGFWAILFGISSLVLAWRLRGLQEHGRAVRAA